MKPTKNQAAWAATTLVLLALAGVAPVFAQSAPAATPTPDAGAQAAAPAKAPDAKPETAAPAAKPAEAKAKGAGMPLESVLKDGFLLRTPDKKTELKLAASVQLDSRFYGGDSVAPDSFDIRRARLDFNAKLYDFMAVRIQAALEDSPYIRNAILDIGTRDALHLRVGQMKVPFSSQWLTLDNQVDFIERGSAEPVYPFFDRGFLLWGALAKQKLVYNLGVFTGAGVDLDNTKGDIDDHKDVAWRLFMQPLRGSTSAAEGIYLVLQGTYGLTSVPTRRYETRGLMAANFESLLWRWRTEQVIGTNGRLTDQISGEIDSRTRWGAELHYQRGPFVASAEWAKVKYEGIQIFHDLFQGSKRLKHVPVLARDGEISNMSVWASYFLTGEKKLLDNFGWRQPSPDRPWGPGLEGGGAWEILARFSTTETDAELFDSAKVNGFTAADFTDTPPPTPGDGSSVNAAVVEGARKVYEATLGVNWTMNYNLRIQLDFTTIWAPDFVPGKNGIVSGGNSDLADPTIKNTLVEKEHMVGMRFIFRI
ncbi:MAG: porin [Acidobacteriota bacterium]